MNKQKKLRSQIRQVIREELLLKEGVEPVWQCYGCGKPDAPPGANVTHGLCEKCFKAQDAKTTQQTAAPDEKPPKPGWIKGPNGEFLDPDDDDAWDRAISAAKMRSGQMESKKSSKLPSLVEMLGCGCGWTCAMCAPEDYDPEDELGLTIPDDQGETKVRTRIPGRDDVMLRFDRAAKEE